MSRYRMSKGEAIDLQEWALEVSGAGKFLKNLSELPKTKKIKPGLYVDYEIDEDDLDDGIDWPAPRIAAIYAVIKNNEPKFLGEVLAYNWETYWLSTSEDEEVDTAENWWEIINEEYKRLMEEAKK